MNIQERQSFPTSNRLSEQPPSATRPFTIEAVSYQSGVSVSRIRYFERAGLLVTARSSGSLATYDERDLERVRQIDRLINDLGVNLAGVEVILNMRDRMLYLLEELEMSQRSGTRR
jgi:MerR family transcriptional regulator, heat shock protein HspR